MTITADTGADEQVIEQSQQQQDGETGQDPGESGGDGGDDELVVSFGEESPPPEAEEVPENAPAWVRTLRADQQELRKTLREKDKREKELLQELEVLKAPKQESELKKPTMESVDYDEAEYERQFEAYNQQKAGLTAKQREKEAADNAEKAAWTEKVQGYQKAKTELKVKDYDDAEAEAASVLSQIQQSIIVNGADNSALLIYALGKNPVKAKELASIKDPVKFAFAVAKLETQLKATPRKAPPAAESTVRGSGSTSSTSSNSELTRLEAEAERTGDRSKVVSYRKRLAEAQAKK